MPENRTVAVLHVSQKEQNELKKKNDNFKNIKNDRGKLERNNKSYKN